LAKAIESQAEPKYNKWYADRPNTNSGEIVSKFPAFQGEVPSKGRSWVEIAAAHQRKVPLFATAREAQLRVHLRKIRVRTESHHLPAATVLG